jgi:hypothetical protein
MSSAVESPEAEALIQGYLEGSLTDDQSARLCGLLHQNPTIGPAILEGLREESLLRAVLEEAPATSRAASRTARPDLLWLSAISWLPKPAVLAVAGCAVALAIIGGFWLLSPTMGKPDGTFRLVTSVPTLMPPPGISPEGAGWGDYGNDGYLDLFVADNAGATNLFYRNNGDGTFTKITSGSPVNDGALGTKSSAVAWADYDNDGFLDLFISRNNPNGTTGMANLLYHNNGNSDANLLYLFGASTNLNWNWLGVRSNATGSVGFLDASPTNYPQRFDRLSVP